ncbi:MAG: glycerol-3-phosphate 1-O-acyltransferase PlsY [Opitutales bacterium]|nr:glycerol-3-phosphate 1-O-acyltransferase PlsY [Opitutales bacterium]
MEWIHLSVFVFGYIVGSIPFGVLIARSKGINIFQEGSGNPGATNVGRILGKRYGFLVFFLDALKGFSSVIALHYLAHQHPQLEDILMATALAGAVTGHCFSIFLKFRGGKGVATTIGGLLAIMPSVTILCLLLWYSVFRISRFVSLASLSFALMLPLLTYLFAYSETLLYLSLALMIFLIWRHVPNLRRLWRGQENRFPPKA